MANETNQSPNAFPETRWSVISRARKSDPQLQRAALEEFCKAYWLPLYGYARRCGKSEHDAEDLLQGFFLKLLDNEASFEGLDAARGKLRSWLLTGFKRFMINDWEKANRQKRGGEAEIISFDLEDAEHRLSETAVDGEPDEVYDRQWARAVLSRSRQQLRDAHERAGKADEFAILKAFLNASCELTSSAAAEKLGKKEGTVRMAISRLRNDYRIAIRSEIADTVGPESDVDAEMNYLISCLASN